MIIDPGPVPLFDPLSRTIKLFPFLRTCQYSQYVTEFNSIGIETIIEGEEENTRIGMEKGTDIKLGIRKKMTVNSEQKNEKVVRNNDMVSVKKVDEEDKRNKEVGESVRTGEGSCVTKELDAEDLDRRSEVEKEVESVRGTVRDIDLVEEIEVVEDVEERQKEEEEEEEVEEGQKEEVLCVLLFALRGSVDDTIVSTACSYLLFTIIQLILSTISSKSSFFIPSLLSLV